jgi:hypothetical protein
MRIIKIIINISKGHTKCRSSSRYIRMVIAAAVCLALALTSATAASASPDHAAPSARGPAVASAQIMPPGLLQGSALGQPVIIQDSADASGVIGYLTCLYNSQNHCISDTANLGAGGVIQEVLTTIGDGVTVWGIVKAAHKSYKWVKKYLYKGKHIYTRKGDGLCMADFGYNQIAAMKSCGDKHGIYWQVTTGAIWNTYAKGDLVASSLKNDTRLYVHKAKDWHTWVLREICENKC